MSEVPLCSCGKWVGHRPGQARLWMGVGAIVAFAPILGSVSSEENTGTKICEQHMPSPCGLGSSEVMMPFAFSCGGSSRTALLWMSRAAATAKAVAEVPREEELETGD